MSKVVKKVTKPIQKIIAPGLPGGGAAAPTGPTGPDPWEEYTRGRGEMEEQRTRDLSGLRARLGASGMREGSAGWERAFESLQGRYQKKLEDYGSQSVFDTIRSRAGFGRWSDEEVETPGEAEKPGGQLAERFGGVLNKWWQQYTGQQLGPSFGGRDQIIG